MIYIGGAMTVVRDKTGDHPRTCLDAIDAATGESKPFAPRINGRVDGCVRLPPQIRTTSLVSPGDFPA
jgi:hypothetical protein